MDQVVNPKTIQKRMGEKLLKNLLSVDKNVRNTNLNAFEMIRNGNADFQQRKTQKRHLVVRNQFGMEKNLVLVLNLAKHLVKNALE